MNYIMSLISKTTPGQLIISLASNVNKYLYKILLCTIDRNGYKVWFVVSGGGGWAPRGNFGFGISEVKVAAIDMARLILSV